MEFQSGRYCAKGGINLAEMEKIAPSAPELEVRLVDADCVLEFGIYSAITIKDPTVAAKIRPLVKFM